MDANKQIRKAETYYKTLAGQEADYHLNQANKYSALMNKAWAAGKTHDYYEFLKLYNYHVSEYRISAAFKGLRGNFASNPEQFAKEHGCFW